MNEYINRQNKQTSKQINNEISKQETVVVLLEKIALDKTERFHLLKIK